MPRLDDLLDLARVAHDSYLISPTYNARTVYILIDDLCELTFKVWLPENTGSRQQSCRTDLQQNGIITGPNHQRALRNFFRRQIDRSALFTSLGATAGQRKTYVESALRAYGPQEALLDWSPSYANGRFKSFPKLIDEVRDRQSGATTAVHDLLNRIDERRQNRNRLFHDPNQAGLTVDEHNCLSAIMDYHTLSHDLFEQSYRDSIQANSVLAAQITALRIRLKGHTAFAVTDIHNFFRQQQGPVVVEPHRAEHEYCVLHEDPFRYLERIRDQIQREISDREYRILEIEGMARPREMHHREQNRLEEEIALRREIIDECIVA